MMKMFMPGPNEPVPSGMEAEIQAVNSLVEFYCVLEQVSGCEVCVCEGYV